MTTPLAPKRRSEAQSASDCSIDSLTASDDSYNATRLAREQAKLARLHRFRPGAVFDRRKLLLPFLASLAAPGGVLHLPMAHDPRAAYCGLEAAWSLFWVVLLILFRRHVTPIAMRVVLPQEKTFLPGPGRCIYCWPTDNPPGPFGREHIIAQKLGGKLILHQASCKDCEELINREIENPSLNRIWISSRAQLGLPSSRPRTTVKVARWKGKPGEFPKDLTDPRLDGHWDEVPLSNRAFAILLPRFSPPALLYDKQGIKDLDIIGLDHHVEGLNVEKPDYVTAIAEPMNTAILARFLAKVAHGAAVAVLGMDTFEPALTAIIKGDSDVIGDYVGSSRRRGLSHPDALHQITLETHGGFLVARVQLFARFGLRPYQVVVGRLLGEASKWHSSAQTTVPT